jgi:hypothetical protein
VGNRVPAVTLTAPSSTCIHPYTEEGLPPCGLPCPGSATLTLEVEDPDGDPVSVSWSHSNPTSCSLADPTCTGPFIGTLSAPDECAQAVAVTCSSIISGCRAGSWTATATDPFGLNASQTANTNVCGCACQVCPNP